MRSKSGYAGVRAHRSGKILIEFEFGARENRERFSWTLDLPQTPRGFAEAFAIREARRERVKNGLPPIEPDRENPTVYEVAEEWKQHVIAEGRLSTRTVNGHIGALNRYWLPRLADIRVRDLRFATLRAIDDETKWNDPKTRANVVGAIRVLLRFAHESDYVDHNPAAKFNTRLHADELAEPEAYSLQERDTILNWLKEHAPATPAMYFTTGFATGLRTGELLALKWTDQDEFGFEIERAVSRGEIGSTKTRERRFVPVVPSLAKALLEYRRGQMERGRHTGFVFKTQYGDGYKRSDKLNPWFHKACEATQVRCLMGRHKPYPWRHTFISEAYDAGMDPWTCADIVGNSVETARKHYRARKQRDRLIEAMKALEA